MVLRDAGETGCVKQKPFSQGIYEGEHITTYKRSCSPPLFFPWFGHRVPKSWRKFREGDFSLLRTRPNQRRLRQSGNLNQQAPSPSHRRARRLEGDKAPSTKAEGVGVGRRWGTRNPKKLKAGGL